MGTEVLRPQDFLSQRIGAPPSSFSWRRAYGTTNSSVGNFYRGSRKPATRPEQRRRVVEQRWSSDSSRSIVLGMEKVTILRRGESLDSKLKAEAFKNDGNDLVVVGTQRHRPDPQMVSKQIRIVDFRSGREVYAGSAFAVSPSPSALPLPSFWKRQQPTAKVEDSASRDLRRLLRLE